jgi:hypothetical protein
MKAKLEAQSFTEDQQQVAEIIMWPYDQRELKRRANQAAHIEYVRRVLGGQSINAQIIHLPVYPSSKNT